MFKKTGTFTLRSFDFKGLRLHNIAMRVQKDLFIKNRTRTVVKLLLFWFYFL